MRCGKGREIEMTKAKGIQRVKLEGKKETKQKNIANKYNRKTII